MKEKGPDSFWYWAESVSYGLLGEDGIYHGDELLKSAEGDIERVIASVAKLLIEDHGFTWESAQGVFRAAQCLILSRAMGTEDMMEEYQDVAQ